MKQHAAFVRDLRERVDVLQRSDLAIRRFDGDQSRIRFDRGTQRVGIDEAFAIGLKDRDVGDALRRREDRSMLDSASDEMRASVD